MTKSDKISCGCNVACVSLMESFKKCSETKRATTSI
jgi:hypothetical protein